MAIINISRLIHRHKRLFLLTTTGAIFVLGLTNIFSFIFPYTFEDELSPAHFERLKRDASQPDPINEKDYLTDDLFSEAVMGRFSRRILNESMSFAEESGSKRPIPIKKLNKAYTEAKKMYFAKKNCVPRPPPTPSTTPKAGGAAPAAGGAPTPAPPGGEAAAPAPPPEEPPAEPPAAERRRRAAIEATTERVYYCDEFTTTTTTTVAPPTTTKAAAAAAEAPTPAAAPTEAPPAE